MLPVLYSFRRCPFAIRARMTIACSGETVALREVLLRDMPADMLACSPKGTVPVLVLPDGRVIDESRDIMHWALECNDPDHWLGKGSDWLNTTNRLLDENDITFKSNLDRYKYADRYPEHPGEFYRTQSEVFLRQLESRLDRHRYLLGETMTMADIAIFPFIRQFACVDTDWFCQTDYRRLQQWLDGFLASRLFTDVMQKYPVWKPGVPATVFPG